MRPPMRSYTGAFGFSAEFREALAGAADAAEELARRRSVVPPPPDVDEDAEEAGPEPVTVPVLRHAGE